MSPQLEVGNLSGCQIGAIKAQCAFDARRVVEAFDLNSAFTKERRHDTFKGVHKRMLPFYVWGYGRETPLLCRGRTSYWFSGNWAQCGGEAVSTFEVFESIRRDAAEKLVAEQFFL